MHSIKLAKVPYALDVICNLHFCQTEKQLLLFLFVKVCIKVAHKLNLIKYSHHVFQLMLAKLLHYIFRTILLNPVALCCTMYTKTIFYILFLLIFQNDIEFWCLILVLRFNQIKFGNENNIPILSVAMQTWNAF